MLRYVCKNPNCLNTFLSADLEEFKKCKLCGQLLIHVGTPQKNDDSSYPPRGETIEDLKISYLRLRKQALNDGLTQEECQIMGRAIRKISFEERKSLLQQNGVWDEKMIYKHVRTRKKLMKMVVDKSAMAYRKKRDTKKERQ